MTNCEDMFYVFVKNSLLGIHLARVASVKFLETSEELVHEFWESSNRALLIVTSMYT